MEILRAILNQKISRIVFGIIIMCALGSPTVNGFTENQIWLQAAILWIVLVIISCFTRLKFTPRNNWIIYLLIAGIIILLYLLIRKFT